MVRIYKHYEFALASPHHALKRVSFSSYPGELSSDDDFYLMDTGLALLQTTNDILDTDLYRLLTPRSLLNWQRVRQASVSLKLSICSLSFTVLGVGFSLIACCLCRLANAMATSGPEWAALVSEYNSGTYNNQYMVVNLSLFQPGQELQPDLLWVIEQVRPSFCNTQFLIQSPDSGLLTLAMLCRCQA